MPRRPISLEQLDNLSVDSETNQLFWHDKAVMTVVSLPWWVQVAALAGGLGSAISALVAFSALTLKLFHVIS
jgi:hypothetical protein